MATTTLDRFGERAMKEAAMELGDAQAKAREWLIEEGYSVRAIPDPEAAFNFAVQDDEGRNLTVVQAARSHDGIAIATYIDFGVITERLAAMASEKREEIFWRLRFALMNLGVGFGSIDATVDRFQVDTMIYYDGLTKDHFLRQVFLLRRAVTMTFWILSQEFQEPPRALGFKR